MKSHHVTALLRAAIESRHDDVQSIARQIEAHERSGGRNAVANEIAHILQRAGSRLLSPLQFASDCAVVLEPAIDPGQLVLDAVVLDCLADVAESYAARDELVTWGLSPLNKILMAGPPGCGKTSVAEALAKRCGLPFAVAAYSSLIDSYMGHTSANIDKLFKEVSQRPCVLFLDEFDAVAMSRTDSDGGAGKENNRIVTTLLLAIDRFSPSAILVAATNRPDSIDRAVTRRFDLTLFLEMPDASQRERFVELGRKRFPFLNGELDNWAVDLDGMSFSDCELWLCQKARKKILAGIKS